MVTQYDVEVYQRLEQLLQHKLPPYPIPEESTVLILLERVSDAQRRATRELKEQLAAAKNGGGRRNNNKRGRPSGEDDLDGVEHLQRQIVQGYLGGSGGRGGALPNQRGGSSNNRNSKKSNHSRQKR